VAPSGDSARVIAQITWHPLVIAKESYRKLRKSSTFAIRQAAARLSPGGGTMFQTTFPPYRLVKVP